MNNLKLVRLYEPKDFILSGTIYDMDATFIQEVLSIIPDIVDKYNCLAIIDDDGVETAVQFYRREEGKSLINKVVVGQARKVYMKDDEKLNLVIDNS